MNNEDKIIGAPILASEYTSPVEYSLSEQFRAAFEEYNSLGAATNMFRNDFLRPSEIDDDYNPFSNRDNIKEGYEKLYIDARSEEDVAYINERIEHEELNDEILASSNPAIAIGVGILDPINLLPLSVLGKGKGFLSTAARVGGTSAIAETGVELMQQSGQQTRTIEESVRNIGITTILSGAAGGALKAMSKYDPDFDVKDFIKRANEDFDNSVRGSVGAAKVTDNISISDLGPAKAFGVEKAIKFQDPISRVLSSPSIVARDIVGRIAEIPFIRVGSQGDVVAKIPVENWVKQWNANKADFITFLDNSYVRYRTGVADATGGVTKQLTMSLADAVRGTSGKLSRSEFSREVSKAVRRGAESDIPEVREAAKYFKQNVLAPLAREAMKITKKDGTSLLPDDLDLTDTSNYLMRLWDKAKILKNSRQFDDMVTAYMRGNRDAAASRIKEWKRLYKQANQLLKEERSKAEDKLIKLSRDERHIKSAVRKAELHWKKVTDRLEKFRPDEIAGSEKKYFNETLRNLKRGGLPNELVTLLGFIRKNGGVKDEGGDLLSQDTSKITTGVINNKTGQSLDRIGELAVQEGYYLERPSVDELLEDIQSELRGESRIYRAQDEDFFIEDSYIAQLASDIEAAGVNINSIKDGTHLKKVLDNLPNADVHYRQSTPATRAKFRELLWHQGVAEKKLRELDAASIKIEDDVIKAANALRDEKIYGSNVAKRVSLARSELSKSAKSVEKIKENLERDKWWGSFTDNDLSDIAKEIRNNIVSGPAGRIEYSYKIGDGSSSSRFNKSMVGARGPLKERTFDIDDLFEHAGIKVEDFLVNDIEAITHAYVNSLSRQAGMVREFGSLDLADEIFSIQSDFEIAASKAANQKEATAIQRAGKNAIRDVMALRDRMLGTYDIPDDYAGKIATGIRSIKTLNYMLYLSNMALSAIPDIARPVMIHGIGRVYGDAFKPMLNNSKAFMAAAKEVKEAGVALDAALHTLALSRADIEEYIDTSSKVESFLHKQSGIFTALTLMPKWNSALKQFTGVVTQSRILDTAINFADGSISKGDKTFLLDNFIDKDIAARIRNQFERYGDTVDGTKIPNARLWDDADAREAFRAAVRRQVDMAIVTPGIGKPLSSTAGGPLGQLGPLIFQFKSFGLASMQRTLLTGLQQRDLAALNGAMLAVGLGSMSYLIKESMAGREPDLSIEKLIVEGVDRSGVTGWLYDVNNMTEKVSRGAFGLSALTDTGPSSRYVNRNIGDILLGPTFGTLQNAAQVGGAAASGDWTESDTRALRKLMIYQNHFAFKKLFDEAESGFNNAFGVKTGENK